MRRFAIAVAALALALAFLPVQPIDSQVRSDFSISLVPTISLPVSPTLPDGLTFFATGAGGSIRAELLPSFLPFALLRFDAGAEVMPVNQSSESLAVVSFGGSAGLAFQPLARLSLRAWGGGGLYLGFFPGLPMVSNPFWSAGVGAGFKLGPALEIGVGAAWRDLLVWLPDTVSSLHSGLSVQAGLSFDLSGAAKGGALKVLPGLLPVFPLFYTYYDKHPAGTIKLTNNERIQVEQVKVSFYAKQYMDGPRLCGELPVLAPGQSAELPVLALFNDQIFKVTEGTKSAGEITVQYSYLGSPRSSTMPVTVVINNRNAITWDDDRKVAAFVAAKNPTVLAFAKNIASTARRVGAGTTTTEIRTAIALFEALRIHGIGYVVDPATPYTKLSTSESAIDFVQFPQQTLAYKAGDCDDISVVYAALLEASGVASAFVTVPGHIFIAVDSGLSTANATRLLAAPTEFVDLDGRAYLPVEVTQVADGFLRAWRTGAREWREAENARTLNWFQTRKAWETYEPVGISDEGVAVLLPASDRVQAAYQTALSGFVQDEIGARVATLKASVKQGRDVVGDLNRLGILYAQFGQLDDAKAQFNAILAKGASPTAYVNLGNIAWLQGQTKDAAGLYRKALAISPESPLALQGLARSLYELEDFAGYGDVVARLKATSPELAAGLAQPGSAPATSRGAEVDVKEVDTWSE